MAVSWPLARPCRSQGRPCRSYSTAHPCALPACRAPACTPAPRACTPVPPARARLRLPAAPGAMLHTSARAPCRPARLSAMSWQCVRAGMAVSWPASRHSAQPPSRPATIQCFVLQLTSIPTKHLSHNCIAIQLLTYCTPLATQPFLLQYNFPSSQYKMGSSPSRFFCTKNLFYFFFFFIYFQKLEKS